MNNPVDYDTMQFVFKRNYIIIGVIRHALNRNINFTVYLLSHAIIKTDNVGQGIVVQKLYVQLVQIFIVTKYIGNFSQFKTFRTYNIAYPSLQLGFMF